eukprot:COSAG02_NODE_4929_length_4821_cov_7.778060_2_plen_287_part_00
MPAGAAALVAVLWIAQPCSQNEVPTTAAAAAAAAGRRLSGVDRHPRGAHFADSPCSPASVVAGAWPWEGELVVTADEFVRFLSPAKIWQRVPVVARRIDSPSNMLISFHPQRLTSDACRTPDMVSFKWSLWIDETDRNIRPDSAANNVYNSPGSRRQDHYYNSGTGSGGDSGDSGGGSGGSGGGSSPHQLVLPLRAGPARVESTALLSLQRALRPSSDGIGLSAALWKDQIGSWGKAPYSTNACATDGSRAWEAVGCSDDRQHVVKVKLLGLADATFGARHSLVIF